MSEVYVPVVSVPEGVYVVVQVPPELSVQVGGAKLPPTPPAVPKVTTPPVTAPTEPLSVTVTVTPVVEPYGAETALTVAVVGAIAVMLKVLLAVPSAVSVSPVPIALT